MGKFETYRETYPAFYYRDCTVTEDAEKISITYHFSIEGLSDFAPGWTFRKNGREKLSASHPMFQKLAFYLGMVELVSYWKISCPKKVVVQCGSLTAEEVLWWKQQYFLGLGEFFYRNEIETDVVSFMDIVSEGEPFPETPLPFKLKGALVPIGGGKDSAATLSLLPYSEENACYLLNPRGSMELTASTAGYGEGQWVTPKRTLDANMLRLNQEGYLNGHTPFSAIIAFSGLLAAALYGKKDVVLSNESSANEATVAGTDINHQYSKSFQFEEDFVNYEKAFLKTGIRYFSLLRPWSEIQIAAYFAGEEQYHSFFKSCNAGSKTDSWCCNCPKCLFIYLILAPFLSMEKLNAIFGEDLSRKESLIPVMEQLIGLSEEKPFECVGSREEVNFAMTMVISRLEKEGTPLPALYKSYKETEFYNEYKEKPVPYGNSYCEENLLPPEYDALMRQVTKKEAAKW